MKKIILAILFITASSEIFAQALAIIESESKVQFVIKNFGLKTEGQLKGLKGAISFDPSALNNSAFNVSVNAATIDTDNKTRDKHLRKADYFDVEQFPTINFTSTKISKTAAGAYTAVGNLTMKGITKTITMPFTATAVGNGYLLKSEFDLNRRDFKVGGSSLALSDNLKVMLEVKVIKP